MESYPSIFNDVIGPVMRGPSSSHCAAALRIGRICRELMDNNIKDILVAFDPNGSLANTHRSQGSDMGLFGGFLGWEADDERLPESDRFIRDAGINVQFEITDIGADHPNTYHIILSNEKESRRLTAVSTGGGMITVVAIDGTNVSMAGDFYETLIYCELPDKVTALIQERMVSDDMIVHSGDRPFVEIKAQTFPEASLCKELLALKGVQYIKKLSPVLPVLSRKNLEVPFVTCEEMLVYSKDKSLALWELALRYESARGHIPPEEVFEKMQGLVRIMRKAIQNGLKGTAYADRLLGSQSVKFKKKLQNKQLVEAGALNKVIMYVSALMEVKSSMGVIVAAPTAGSCGALPGAVIGVADAMEISEDMTVKAMLTAGLIGIFIAKQATFAGEVAGCEVEFGSGGCMAAAGIVCMAGGSTAQSIAAASMVLQSTLGLTCTPIANRVEAPCLNNNVMAASNALSCANMALSDYDPLIPLDEVIDIMYKIGKALPHEFKCTNMEGLCATRTAKALEARLDSIQK